MAVGILPQMILVFPFFFVLLLPPVSLNLWYICSLPKVCDEIPRNTCAWRLHCITQDVLSAPAHAVAIFSLLLSRLVMLAFGVLYYTLSCAWGRYCRNAMVIIPHDAGPSLYPFFGDCIAAAAGMVYRQGLFEFVRCFALMFIVNTWFKYWLTGNTFVCEHGERFITQIGQSMSNMVIEDFDADAHNYISRAKTLKQIAKISMPSLSVRSIRTHHRDVDSVLACSRAASSRPFSMSLSFAALKIPTKD